MSNIKFTSEAIDDPQFGCRWLVSAAGYSVVAASIAEGQREIVDLIAFSQAGDPTTSPSAGPPPSSDKTNSASCTAAPDQP